MRKIINFGDEEMEFQCSAATPILYKMMFGEDLLVALSKPAKQKEKEEQATLMNEIIQNLAYIMYVEANYKGKEIFSKLSEELFICWLIEFDPNDLTMHGKEFIELYNKGARTSSKSKNV